jgi:hypothetical protein
MNNREPAATSNLDKTSETEALPWNRARDLLDAGALAEAAVKDHPISSGVITRFPHL